MTTPTVTGGLKDIFLAGVGAMAIGAEKSKELVDQLIAKGEITVDQGKEINSELMKQAQSMASAVGQQAQTAAELLKEQTESAVSTIRSQTEAAGETARADATNLSDALKHDILEAQMAMMTPEQRAEFAAKAAEIAGRDGMSPEAKSQAPKSNPEKDIDPYFNGMEGN